MSVSPRPRGWVVFDGDMEVVGNESHRSIEDAEDYARTHRDAQDPVEHHETMVAWLAYCGCVNGCWACTRGRIIDKQQPWRANWDDK